MPAPICTKHSEAKIQYKKGSGFSWRCKSCNREYQRDWFAKNKEKQRLRIARNRIRARSILLDYLKEYLLTHPCIDCDEDDPVVLEFDHRNPSDKLNTISKLLSLGGSLSVFQAEITKCDVRCANCHARRTAKQFGWAKLNWN